MKVNDKRVNKITIDGSVIEFPIKVLDKFSTTLTTDATGKATIASPKFVEFTDQFYDSDKDGMGIYILIKKNTESLFPQSANQLNQSKGIFRIYLNGFEQTKPTSNLTASYPDKNITMTDGLPSTEYIVHVFLI